MKLVILIGNTSVGKMTVGQELAKITDLRLFHNHMSIEPVMEIFGYFNGRASARIREVIFEEVLKSDLAGLIFTYMWAFNEPSDWDYIKNITTQFTESGAEVYYVELVASQKIRLARNTTENRLDHKPSKRNLDFSKSLLIEDDKNYRLESNDGEIQFKNYFKIDNSDLEPKQVAMIIKEHFNF
ncbi:shikimate kinase [Amphibacillus sp. Q70]|uniref:shikimate kinase n=1 Tax=Amphibacillus sp. Q70 TaxID=3453416 RepID=UPI003F8782CB